MLGYMLRRFILMLGTLIMVSMVSFAVIELPPGDYLEEYVNRLEQSGATVDMVTLQNLRIRYGLDKPMHIRYLRWVWGVLHGNFGMSFDWNRPVEEIIWSRLGLTVAISFSALLFSWIIGFPIAIYSATHPHSIGDYVFTALGFMGLATPSFMLALVLMWIAFAYLGFNVGGLFSPQYADAPWSMAKAVDFLKHVWIPMIIIGTGGTAGLIRTVRANLLDELSKPYVEVARAKGLPERRLLLKYPLRVSLNPFFSTIGWSLAGLVSGTTIVAVVLDLPTTGPLLLRALLAQDTYMAGSFIMMLSVLTVIGTFLSDLLLAWVDPRIRLEG